MARSPSLAVRALAYAVVGYIAGILAGALIAWIWSGFDGIAAYERPGGMIVAFAQGLSGALIIDTLADRAGQLRAGIIARYIVSAFAALGFAAECAALLFGGHANIWSVLANGMFLATWLAFAVKARRSA